MGIAGGNVSISSRSKIDGLDHTILVCRHALREQTASHEGEHHDHRVKHSALGSRSRSLSNQPAFKRTARLVRALFNREERSSPRNLDSCLHRPSTSTSRGLGRRLGRHRQRQQSLWFRVQRHRPPFRTKASDRMADTAGRTREQRPRVVDQQQPRVVDQQQPRVVEQQRQRVAAQRRPHPVLLEPPLALVEPY